MKPVCPSAPEGLTLALSSLLRISQVGWRVTSLAAGPASPACQAGCGSSGLLKSHWDNTQHGTAGGDHRGRDPLLAFRNFTGSQAVVRQTVGDLAVPLQFRGHSHAESVSSPANGIHLMQQLQAVAYKLKQMNA